MWFTVTFRYTNCDKIVTAIKANDINVDFNWWVAKEFCSMFYLCKFGFFALYSDNGLIIIHTKNNNAAFGVGERYHLFSYLFGGSKMSFELDAGSFAIGDKVEEFTTRDMPFIRRYICLYCEIEHTSTFCCVRT